MKHHMKHKAKGGSAEEMPDKVSGNPKVFKEEEDHEDKFKKGGKVKKKAKGGKVLGLMTGGAVRPRFDRPARRSGGRVGADSSPLSSAHTTHAAPSMPKTQEGGESD